MVSYKSKERVIVLEDQNEESNIWVERDFLQLIDFRENSSKRVAENEQIQAEIREKDVVLDLSSKRIAEKGQPSAPKVPLCAGSGEALNHKGLLNAALLSISARGCFHGLNEEILAENREKAVILDLSLKKVAENEQTQAKNKEKAVILDLSSKRVAEDEEIQVEIRGKRPKAGTLDLSSKRVVENEQIQTEVRRKKPKFETLDLSLALPSSSSSLQSLEPSNNNTRIGYFRNGSLSSCYSHPFSHNLSYSLTLSSSKDSEYSGERLDWSVFSRVRQVEEGDFRLSSHSHGTSLALGCRLQVNKDNDIDRISSSDSNPFYLVELPARPTGDLRVSGSTDGGRALHQLYQPKRILGEIVSESVPLMAQIVQELPDETIQSTKEFLRSLITIPEKKDFLVSLQNRLNRRSDLTIETLSECNKTQLEFFVAIKMGHRSFLSLENHLQATELIEIFSLERCRNICCKTVLPGYDCKCKICLKNKGFCSECMCLVCFNFDFAYNTCSWIGCDVCSHWCHVVCAIQRNLLKPVQIINGQTEMKFHCLGCGHASEMFGFAREVYMHCAKDWGEETLIKELDYVQKIFDGSEDFKGKELHAITYGLHNKLEKKMISPSDACDFIFHFFKYTDGLSQFLSSSFPASITLFAKSSFNIMSSSSGRKGMIIAHHHQNDAKDPSKSDKMIEDECSAIKER